MFRDFLEKSHPFQRHTPIHHIRQVPPPPPPDQGRKAIMNIQWPWISIKTSPFHTHLLKPDICDDHSLQHGHKRYNTLIPDCRSLAPFRRMLMGWVQRTSEQGPGSSATVQLFKPVCLSLPIDSAHSPFSHAVRGGALGRQCGAVVSVLQTHSSQIFVFKGCRSHLQISLTITKLCKDEKYNMMYCIRRILSRVFVGCSRISRVGC